jgi:uncharacterized protein (TIGR02145 family)
MKYSSKKNEGEIGMLIATAMSFIVATTSIFADDFETEMRRMEVELRRIEAQQQATLQANTIDGSNIFIDQRDGRHYRTVKIGNLTWMAENLNFTIDDSFCYNDNTSNCAAYGRLYNWNAAMSACPAGWRLPTRQELADLIQVSGGVGAAGRKLKSAERWNGTDSFGFSGLPGGMRGRTGAFTNIGEYGYLWSATESGREGVFYRYMATSSDSVLELSGRKTSLLSVRCVSGTR